MKTKLLTLCTLGLALASCGPVVLAPTGTLEGQVVAPGGYDVLSQDQGKFVAAWNAPRRSGQVLILGSSSLSAQSLGALSGVRTLSVDADLTLAFTPAGQSDAEFARALEAQGLKVQPNYLYQTLGNSTPNDTQRPQQTYLDRINVPAAWAALEENKYNPSPVKVAVLDNNFNVAHPDLVGRFSSADIQDFCPSLSAESACVGQDGDVGPDAGTPASERGHGTHSAGIIGAATNNAQGIAGITWSGSTIMPIKIFGGNTRDYGADTIALKKGIDFARSRGARVINMSLGIPFYQADGSPTPGTDPSNYDPAVRASLEAAYNSGVVLVAAAGNLPNRGIFFPASEGTVIAVGGVDANNVLFSVGGFGSARPAPTQTKKIDLVAPGVNILSTDSNEQGALYAQRTGTSEAAPQVAGVAALLLADKPASTALQIKLALTEGATALPGSTSDPDGYGNGLLNAKGALDRLRAGQPAENTPPTNGQLPNNRYSVVVTAQGPVTRTFTTSLRSGENRVSYRFTSLPYGNYTVSAVINKAQPARGSRTINLDQPRENIDVCTDELAGKNTCP